MSNFTIRIQLENPKSGDYDKLDKEMEANFFKKTIDAGNDILYKLPDGEYIFCSTKRTIDVCNIVDRIASTISKNPLILVTKSSGRSWRLKKIDK